MKISNYGSGAVFFNTFDQWKLMDAKFTEKIYGNVLTNDLLTKLNEIYRDLNMLVITSAQNSLKDTNNMYMQYVKKVNEFLQQIESEKLQLYFLTKLSVMKVNTNRVSSILPLTVALTMKNNYLLYDHAELLIADFIKYGYIPASAYYDALHNAFQLLPAAFDDEGILRYLGKDTDGVIKIFAATDPFVAATDMNIGSTNDIANAFYKSRKPTFRELISDLLYYMLGKY